MAYVFRAPLVIFESHIEVESRLLVQKQRVTWAFLEGLLAPTTLVK